MLKEQDPSIDVVGAIPVADKDEATSISIGAPFWAKGRFEPG